MTYPTLQLRVAPDLDPLAFGDPTEDDWTDLDVTGTVKSVAVVTGRQEPFDALQPGTLDVIFDNDNRLYDPLNPESPYYGQLTPGKRVQLQATYGGATSQLYNGFTNGLDVGWGQLYPGDVTLKATDALKYLDRPIPDDAVSTAIKYWAPSAYYRLGDSSGRVLVDSSGNDRHGSWTADLKDWKTNGLVGAYDGAVKLPAVKANVRGSIPREAIPQWDGLSIEFWFQADKGVEAFGNFWLLNGGGVELSIVPQGGPDAGTIAITLKDAAGSTASATTSHNFIDFSVCDGRPHWVCFYYTGIMRVFVDGIDRTAYHLEEGTILTGGATDAIMVSYASWDGEAVLDELAFFTSGDPLARYTEESKAWSGDSTGGRAGRVLASIGWPHSTLADGATILGRATWSADTTVADYLEKIAATEQGQLVVAHWNYGRIEFRGRSWATIDERSTTVQGVFSDQPEADEDEGLLGVSPGWIGDFEDTEATPKVRYESIEIAYDETTVVRQVTVNWDGGTVTVTDPTATATDAIRSATVDTLLASESDARALAHSIIRESADLLRVRSIEIAPTRQRGGNADRAWEQVLQRREGDRILIERQPGGTGMLWSFEVVIEGREHRIDSGAESWVTTFWCTPVSTTTAWVLDVTPFDDTVLSF